jgi:hypothetical protein
MPTPHLAHQEGETMHEVFVSETIGFVWIRPLTARDWCDYLDHAQGTDEQNAWLVVRCTLNREGRRLFRDEEVERVNALPASIVNPISNAILRDSDLMDRDWDSEHRTFRKSKNARFGQRLARDFIRSDTDAFLDELTPTEFQRMRWSYEVDPPVEDLLRATNALLAQLLAVYHNVNFVDDTKEHLTLTGADFLHTPDDVADDGDDGPLDEDGENAPMLIHPMSQPGVRAGIQGVRGTGAKVPATVMALFGGGDAEPEG